MKNVAIIPARSGSKGLKDKNIKLLNGKPLIAYTIEAAAKSNMFEDIIVSTDSKTYAEIARQWGANVPYLRDNELSTDIASSWDVVRDVISYLKQKERNYDTIALLQPTSPLRNEEDIIKGYNIYKEKKAMAVVSVCEVEHSPVWSNTLPEDGSLKDFISKDIINLPRQSLPIYYRLNGALYIVDSNYILFNKNIYNEDCYAVIMSQEHSVDIDNNFDFLFADLVKKKMNL